MHAPLAWHEHTTVPHIVPPVLQMYTTSLPLYCQLVVDSEEGAEGAADSGGWQKQLLQVQLAAVPHTPKLLSQRSV